MNNKTIPVKTLRSLSTSVQMVSRVMCSGKERYRETADYLYPPKYVLETLW